MTASSELFVTEEIRDILEDLLKKENLHVQCPKDWKNLECDAEYPPHGKAEVLWGYEPAEKVLIGTVVWDTHYQIERGDTQVYAEAEPVNVKFYNTKGKPQVQETKP